MQFFKPGDAAPFTVTVVSMDHNAYTAQQQQQQQPAPAWSTGLCDCMDDAGNCCMTCWCPCITFGRVAEIVDRGSTLRYTCEACGMSGGIYAAIMLGTCCQGLYSCLYRSKLRAAYSLPEAPCNDCCVHCSCGCCALCQEYRELKNRGFDMTKGWHLNMEKQRGATGFIEPPMVHGGMMR